MHMDLFMSMILRYIPTVLLRCNVTHARVYFLLRPWVMSLHASITRDECYIHKDLHASNSLGASTSAHVSARANTRVCNKKYTRACVTLHLSMQYRITVGYFHK